MKKIYFLSFIVYFFASCNNEPNIKLKINVVPAKKFIELLDYIDSTSNIKIDTTKHSKKEIANNYNENLQNKELNIKIDELLQLPTYTILSKTTGAFTDSINFEGKDAYRFAFLNLPYELVNMRGGTSETWALYWGKGNNKKSLQFLKKIDTNSKNIEKEAVATCSKYLPKIAYDIPDIKTFICMDGNRSSFMNSGHLYMDLFDFTNYDIDKFKNVVAHELHHAIYSTWLRKKFSFKSDKEKAIYRLQYGVISEGIAQQITYIDYTSQMVSLYNNKELIKELNNDFINALIDINNSTIPMKTYKEKKSLMWKNSMSYLRKYCKNIDRETYSRRPTYMYYIGFLIYNSIKNNGGKEKLIISIEHPENLLQIYNQVWNENEMIPKYPEKLVKIWKDNFENNYTQQCI